MVWVRSIFVARKIIAYSVEWESKVFRQPNHLHHKYTPTALNKVTMPMPAKRLLRILSEGALYEKLLRDTLFRKV